MACSKYEYVKKFQTNTQLLPQTFIMVRIDGKGFTKFCQKHKFKKPNDLRAIDLMNEAALVVMQKFQQIFLSYGQSDQYSFVFSLQTELFNRRQAKILSCVVSTFTSAYVMNWAKHFDIPLQQLPVFDGRCVSYPNLNSLKDYFRWRQVDCHINNLYNTVFWCLVKSGKKNTQVEQLLKVTNSGDKNEILFRDFGINYNTIQEVYRKGTVICYYKYQKEKQKQKQKQVQKHQEQQKTASQSNQTIKQQNKQSNQALQVEGQLVESTKVEKLNTKQSNKQIVNKSNQSQCKNKKVKQKYKLQTLHIDIIKDNFWESIKI